MKKITFLIALLFAAISFAQNQSFGSVQSYISNPISQQFSGTEIFRFRPGIVTQLDSGTSFGFTNSRWFSLGRLNTGTQTVFGLRFQLPNRAATFGYQDLNDSNPRIQWIGDASFSETDLEFRVSNSFSNTNSTLVSTMTHDGRTFFGKPLASSDAKVGIDYTDAPNYNRVGLQLENTVSSGGQTTGIKTVNNAGGYVMTGIDVNNSGSSYGNTGINVRVNDGYYATGVGAYVTGIDTGTTYGVRGAVYNKGNPTGFGAGVYGSAASTNTNRYAGYFSGNVVVTGSFSSGSDEKLKQDIKDEKNVLDKIAQLTAVTYTFKPNEVLSLPETLQHGFIAQNVEEVFPELVTTVSHPVFDKENKLIENYEYKTVNYIGLISILTSSIQQLNEKVATLENEKRARQTIENISKEENKEAFSMDQNIPNPFSDRTVINYTIPNDVKATIAVFDMTGKLIREYNLNETKGNITISSSEIGKGLFLYSLVSGNEVIITKKMMVR